MKMFDSETDKERQKRQFLDRYERAIVLMEKRFVGTSCRFPGLLSKFAHYAEVFFRSENQF